jgi:hypothetical protein
MDPHKQWCHNPDCPARGQVGQGNIHIHSHKAQRYRCGVCERTFAATHGTPFYRLRTAADLVTLVLTLLCHSCPLQAIVAAFLASMSAQSGTGKRGQAGIARRLMQQSSRSALVYITISWYPSGSTA